MGLSCRQNVAKPGSGLDLFESTVGRGWGWGDGVVKVRGTQKLG